MIWFVEDRWILCIPWTHPKGGVFYSPLPHPKHAEFFQPGKETDSVFEMPSEGPCACSQCSHLLKWCNSKLKQIPFSYPEIVRPTKRGEGL